MLTAGGAAAAGAAQERLSLDEAVARARSRHPSAVGAGLAEREAALKVDQARAALYPRVDALESWQRGNLPVFAFSSLLSQRRFTAQDFDVSTPQPSRSPRQFPRRPVGRAGCLRRRRRAVSPRGRTRPRSGGAATATDRTGSRTQTVDTYGRCCSRGARPAPPGPASRPRPRMAASQRPLRGRDARRRPTSCRSRSTRRRCASARSRRRTEAAIARARLNDLDRRAARRPVRARLRSSPAARPAEPARSRSKRRPSRRGPISASRTVEQRAAEAADRRRPIARSCPQVAFRGGWEWNGGTFGTRRGWLVGTEVRLNLFRGFADRARLKGAEAGARTARPGAPARGECGPPATCGRRRRGWPRPKPAAGGRRRSSPRPSRAGASRATATTGPGGCRGALAGGAGRARCRSAGNCRPRGRARAPGRARPRGRPLTR